MVEILIKIFKCLNVIATYLQTSTHMHNSSATFKFIIECWCECEVHNFYSYNGLQWLVLLIQDSLYVFVYPAGMLNYRT